MRKSRYISFLIFLVYRLSSVVFVQTSYVPDEYWQSLEVAHNMAFGYGHLTWEWKEGLRSYLYPFIFSAFFKLLEKLHLDFSVLLIYLPKVLQAILTALSDQYFLMLCQSLGFNDYWTKTVILTNWFWYYCGFRTLTNTFETALNIVALYYYPWNIFIKNKNKNKFFSLFWVEIKKKTFKYATLAAITCIVRPTSVTFWGPLAMLQLFVLPGKYYKDIFLHCFFPAFLISVPVSLIIDFCWYNTFIIPAYNFLKFNIFKEISSFYGTHSFLWYITQGLPVVLGLHYFTFLLGFLILLVKQLRKVYDRYTKIYNIWLFILIVNFIILSNIPHKEFRFALPLTPLMLLIVIKTSSDFFSPSRKKFQLIWSLILTVGFFVLCLVFGVLHQRGTLKLMDYLRNSIPNCQPNCYFLFLMPCHSTPLYSHLHVNVSTRFLKCEPPLSLDHYDESEDFFNNPSKWLSNNWNDKQIPSHVTFFDDIESAVSFFLKEKGFSKKKFFFHTIFASEKFGRFVLTYEPS